MNKEEKIAKIAHQLETNLFLEYVDQWMDNLSDLSAKELFRYPEKCAIVSVDVIKGFCNKGALSSPRVASIVQPIVALMEVAWQEGLRNIILTQDSHPEDACEFSSFPPHCIRGTEESETVDEIQQLPFFDRILVLEKNSIDSGLSNELQQWVIDHPQVENYIVVGDCSDLCTYQLAMYLRLDANERQITRAVIVPENCVQTYDTSVEFAKQIGAFAHPGGFMHSLFLYHMALNGIQVVKVIQ